MNSPHSRRYVFMDYANLRRIKFRKLERVATKIFVFIEAEEEAVALPIVVQAQALGSSLKWVVVHNDGSGNLNYCIAFVLGKFHQKLGWDVEFAVLSHDESFDALIGFINAQGRRCRRVKRSKVEAGAVFGAEEHFDLENSFEKENGFHHDHHSLDLDGENGKFDVLVEEEIIVRTAEETVKRLIRSGNRPMEVATLKNYILLHNQQLSLHGHLESIIEKMIDAKDIEIRKGEVVYNF